MLDFLRRSPLKSSLQERLLAPLYTSFLLLVFLILIQAGLNLLLEIQYRKAVKGVQHSLLIEREGARLLGAVLDEQTSLRGYLLTGRQEILEPYRLRAQTAFQESFDQLHELVQQNPAQLQQLMQIRSTYDGWQRQFARRVLNGTANRTTLPGKTLFDPMRDHMNDLLQIEEEALKQRNQQVSYFSSLRTAMDVFSLLIILMGVAWNLWLLRRRVEQPLQTLTEVGQTWRTGQLDVRLNYSAPGEIGRLASVLDSMAWEIRDRQERSHLRNQQLEDLISALSHDLRTPLLATRATLRPMLNGGFGAVPESWREILEEYQQANEDLIKLVNTLLDVSRYESGGSHNLVHAPIDWQRILTRATAQVQASTQKQCEIIIHIAPVLPIVAGDPLEIQRVIQNLVDNAVRVSEVHQSILVEVMPWHKNQVKVAVCDRGSGILPHEKERLFHRFIQGRGRRGGAGLGLYLCRQIVEAHGGTISVDSQVGEGSTFWFVLPSTAED
ncbi:MAG TPA: ATP-binding protein [Trichocoleus sp.]